VTCRREWLLYIRPMRMLYYNRATHVVECACGVAAFGTQLIGNPTADIGGSGLCDWMACVHTCSATRAASLALVIERGTETTNGAQTRMLSTESLLVPVDRRLLRAIGNKMGGCREHVLWLDTSHPGSALSSASSAA
jgi:hypothetical protein